MKIEIIGVRGMKKVTGKLTVYKNGDIYVGKMKLLIDDVIHLPVIKLKKIIQDAKAGII